MITDDGLYYDSAGDGPLLLLIPGGNGDAGPFGPLLRLLSDRFRVVAYDRRGFSRSKLAGPLAERFDQDVQDAADLIDMFGGGTGHVFGSSSGAIIGLHLVTRHPEKVRRLVAHEPPLVGLLPDGDEWFEFFEKISAMGRTEPRVAMQQFAAATGQREPGLPPGVQLPDEVMEMIRRMAGNLEFFLEQELTNYTRREPDREALVAHRDKVTLAGGRESRDAVPYRPNLVLAEWLGLRVHDYPGDHIGYATEPGGFAAALRADLP